MNKTRKTYGIKGFMEYQAVIKVGKSRMKVPFTDGTLTAMGVVPCTFTTERLMVQHAIENSDEYKRGLIYTVSTMPLDEKVEIERKTPVPDEPVAEAHDEPAAGAQEAPVTQVEFASNDEAKDYLEQQFGLVRSKLRNREDIYNAGMANGIEIIFV